MKAITPPVARLAWDALVIVWQSKPVPPHRMRPCRDGRNQSLVYGGHRPPPSTMEPSGLQSRSVPDHRWDDLLPGPVGPDGNGNGWRSKFQPHKRLNIILSYNSIIVRGAGSGAIMHTILASSAAALGRLKLEEGEARVHSPGNVASEGKGEWDDAI